MNEHCCSIVHFQSKFSFRLSVSLSLCLSVSLSFCLSVFQRNIWWYDGTKSECNTVHDILICPRYLYWCSRAAYSFIVFPACEAQYVFYESSQCSDWPLSFHRFSSRDWIYVHMYTRAELSSFLQVSFMFVLAYKVTFFSFKSIRPGLLWKCYFEQCEHRKELVKDGKVKNCCIATGKPTPPPHFKAFSKALINKT